MAVQEYLGKTGVQALWNKIKAKFYSDDNKPEVLKDYYRKDETVAASYQNPCLANPTYLAAWQAGGGTTPHMIGSIAVADLKIAHATETKDGVVKVLQGLGNSATDPMSQKAITDLINRYHPDYTSIRDAVRGGGHPLQVGDIIMVGRTDAHPAFEFQVIGIDQDTPVDTSLHHSLTLQMKNIWDNRKFSAANSNIWSSSDLRTWANGDLLNLLDPEFVSVLKPVTKITHGNSNTGGTTTTTTQDTFFALSRTEVYMTVESGGVAEGSPYQYYRQFSSLTAPGNGADPNRIKTLNGAATWWWLRTPYPSIADHVWSVSTDGSGNDDLASYSNGAALACVIA